MARWTCPRCDREFARAHQSHTCLPGNSVDETFRGKPPEFRAIFAAVMDRLRPLGPVHADAVQVGVFLKSDRKLAELRPKSRWMSCSFYVSRVVDDARVARSIRISATRVANEVKLRTVDDVDDQLGAWLSEAFAEATD
ncbi:MAG TPA: DUF5655 domain-containing protein [Acidimicrobiia bacterium]|nr:DUF5655 domain-containing protein [Acidimicrobiia bacterium]